MPAYIWSQLIVLLRLVVALAAEHNEVKTLPHLDRQLLLYTTPPLATDPVTRDALIKATTQPCAREGPTSSAPTYSRMICASSGAWWAVCRSFNKLYGGPQLLETDPDADAYDSYVKWRQAASKGAQLSATFRVSDFLTQPNATKELFMQSAMLVSKLIGTLNAYNRCSREIRQRLENHRKDHALGPNVVGEVGCDCQGVDKQLDSIHNKRFYAAVYAFALNPLCALAMADTTLRDKLLPFIEPSKTRVPQSVPRRSIKFSVACLQSANAAQQLWKAITLEADYQKAGLSIPPSAAIDIRGLRPTAPPPPTG